MLAHDLEDRLDDVFHIIFSHPREQGQRNDLVVQSLGYRKSKGQKPGFLTRPKFELRPSYVQVCYLG